MAGELPVRARGPASNAHRIQLLHARIAGTSARQGRRRPRAGAGIAPPRPLLARDHGSGLEVLGLDWDRRLQKRLGIEEGIDRARGRAIAMHLGRAEMVGTPAR
ncbi:MAG: hypothetical protein ACP5PV_02185 [Methanothrix sp.]